MRAGLTSFRTVVNTVPNTANILAAAAGSVKEKISVPVWIAHRDRQMPQEAAEMKLHFNVECSSCFRIRKK
ncbi:hypothetical protein AB6A40_009551 [Gnathostoma spinigerum]|uniref:Uncharacterized protein n=1 Tax=Gnathostoma spinigerum TaxID=75299 RepID=A0ABD6EUQ2_9BILA